MTNGGLRFAGIELYFEDLDEGKPFYHDLLGLEISSEDPGHFVTFGSGSSSFHIERKGSERIPLATKRWHSSR